MFIDSITVSDLKVKQSGAGILNVEGSGGTTQSKNFCSAVTTANAATGIVACLKADDARGFSLSTNGATGTGTGTATDPAVVESTLEGGRTNALVMEVTQSGTGTALDIGSDVNISDKLNLVLRFTSGQDELLTDVFTTRVKPG